MDFDRSPVLNLLRVAHRLEGRLATRWAPLDLWLVAGSDEAPTVTQIREQLLDPASNRSRLLNKLTDAPWIDKVRERGGQGVVRVGLTEAGRRILAQGGQALAEELGVLDCLDEIQTRTLAELLGAWE